MDNFRDSYFQVDWDLTTKRLRGTYWGKQYDTGRGFAVTVINGGQVVAPTTEVLRLKWEKPDNTTGYVNATIVDGKFIVENIDQMFTVAGSVRADFELSVGGKFVASITFYVSVEKAVAVDAVASSSQFTALQDAVGSVDSLQQQFNNVVANATVDSEVIAARGTEATLGARLDSADAQLADIATKLIKSPNLFNKETVINDNTLDLGTGVVTQQLGWKVSDFILVKPSTTYSRSNRVIVVVYNDKKEMISGFSENNTPINIIETGKFVRISMRDANYSNLQFEEGAISTPYRKYGSFTLANLSNDSILNEHIKNKEIDESKVSFVNTSPNLFNKDDVVKGYKIDTHNRVLIEDANWVVSDFIPVEPNTDYVRSHDSIVLTYDRNKQVIGSYSENNTNITTVDEVYYTKIAVKNIDLGLYQFEKGVKTDYMEFETLSIPNLYITPTVKKIFSDELEREITDENSELSKIIKKGTAHGGIKKKPILPLIFETMSEQLQVLATAYDGNVYGISDTNWYTKKSTDGGVTFTQGAHPGVGQACNMVVFEDGSVVVVSIDGKFAHSEGFDKPFTIVMDIGATFSGLNFSSYTNGIEKYVLAGEYGHTSTMKKLWLSKDGGLTYSVLKEGDTLHTGNNHWHTAAFDPYSGGIFASQGDGNNARLYYTPDFGVTWNYIDNSQPTAIYALPSRVIFGRDNAGVKPGMSEWNRGEVYPVTLEDAITFREDMWAYNFYPINSNWNNGSPNEYYMLFFNHVSELEPVYIYATGDGGESWHIVYENTTPRVRSMTGIDKHGYIYCLGGATLHRAKRLTWEYDLP